MRGFLPSASSGISLLFKNYTSYHRISVLPVFRNDIARNEGDRYLVTLSFIAKSPGISMMMKRQNISGKEEFQQGLLCMQPVFSLVKHPALPAFHHLIGNLLTSVDRHAVEHNGIFSCE